MPSVLGSGSTAEPGGGADGDPAEPAAGWLSTVRAALEAVEAERGGAQRYFEVTADPRVTNVFVAVDDETAVIAYAFLDGELQPPAPRREGASGRTFGLDDVAFEAGSVLDGVASELPTATVESLSVYGAGSGATYVVLARSSAGGLLDVEVGPGGEIRAVDPR